MNRLSRHFVERWTQRVGAAPTVDGVNRIIQSSSQIRHRKRLWEDCPGGGLRPFIQLAEFLYRPSGIIIKVDQRSGVAVTVIAP
ncbi:MAG: hypothetical protein LLF99_06845 [Desulfobacteraceae bacterium]|nr:hypothetical protein [Desulfobacteraceae bacterium]